MTKINKVIIILFLSCLISACINKNSYRKLIKTDGRAQKILVVSSMGDDFITKFVGFTIFTNKNEKVNVKSWDLDTRIEQELANLKVNDNFSITNMDISHIKSKYPDLGYDSFFSKIKFYGLDKEIFPFAAEHDFDLVIFVQANITGDNVFLTGVPLEGYGLYKRSLQAQSAFYAAVQISIYDVKSQKKLLHLPASATSERTNKFKNVKVGQIRFDDIADQKEKIVKLIIQGVKERMQYVKIAL